MFVFVKDCDLYGRSQRGFSHIWRQSSWLPLDVGPCQRVHFYLIGRSAAQGAIGVCMCVCTCMCVFALKCLGLSLLFTFWKHFGGVKTAVAGTCVQDCTQYVHVASAPVEVRRCEIRWRFVEGDNEQSAILTGWAMCCKVWNCYTLSDFNHCMLLFFLFFFSF